MPKRSKRKRNALSVKTAELAVAAPQVIAHRMARLAASGLSPSERDRKEFRRMSTEKMDAFIESWNEMAMQAFRANQALGVSVLRSFWRPWFGRKLSVRTTSSRFHHGALDVLGKGLGPIHRRAVANAKRLAGGKRR